MSASKEEQGVDDPWIGLVRRELLSVLRRAAICVRTTPISAENVHRARRCFKRAAALLRLFDAVDADRSSAYVARARVFRQSLGAARDLDVVAQTFATFAPDLPSKVATTLLHEIDGAASALRDVESREAHADLGPALRELTFDISHWDLREADATALVKALALSYRKARRRGRSALDGLAPTDLHEFRKALITYREQLAILRPAWPKLVDALCAEAQSLRNALGGLNDLTVMSGFVGDVDADGAAQLAILVAPARADLLALVAPAWLRLFSESPRGMADRVAAWIEHPKKRPDADVAKDDRSESARAGR